MAGNIQIPQDVAKVLQIEVKETSDQLRKFLTDLLNELTVAQDAITALELRVTELENGN